MDVSKIVWPIVIVAVIGVCWLLTSSGVNYMFERFTSAVPGEDADKDESYEAGLTRLGGFLVRTFRNEKANEVLLAAVERYPNGENVWYNYLRLARCAQRMDEIERSVSYLSLLIENDATQYDDRIPNSEILTVRRQLLMEMHGLAK